MAITTKEQKHYLLVEFKNHEYFRSWISIVSSKWDAWSDDEDEDIKEMIREWNEDVAYSIMPPDFSIISRFKKLKPINIGYLTCHVNMGSRYGEWYQCDYGEPHYYPHKWEKEIELDAK